MSDSVGAHVMGFVGAVFVLLGVVLMASVATWVVGCVIALLGLVLQLVGLLVLRRPRVPDWTSPPRRRWWGMTR